MDLADILTTSEEEPQQAPDSASDPAAALDFHRSRWPLNSKVAAGTVAAGEGSDRIRLRKVAATLSEQGFSVSGAEPASYVPGAKVSISAHFGSAGNASRPSVTLGDIADLEEALESVQNAFQRQGFAALVTMQDTIAFPSEYNEESARYVEAGGYGGRFSGKISGEELLSWRAVISEVNEHDIEGWISIGVSAEKALQWIEAGARGSYEASRWMDAGQDCDGAKEWIAVGIGVWNSSEWVAAGLSPADAEVWVEVGVSDRASAAKWEAAGFDPDSARALLSIRGLHSPDQAKLLTDNNVPEDTISDLAAAKLNAADIEAVAEWVGRYKIELPEALEWASLGRTFIGPGKRGRWHKAGFTPQQVEVWQKVLGKQAISLDEVRALVATGHDPEAAEKWAKVNPALARGSVSQAWIDAGLGPDDAKKWVKASPEFVNYSLVKGWLDDGLDEKQAKKWAAAAAAFDQPSLCDRAVVKSWIEADRRCQDPEMTAKLMQVTSPELLPQIIELLT